VLLQQTTLWENFRATRADIEHLFSLFLEHESPLSNRELALYVIQYRLLQEEEQFTKQLKRGAVFQPRLEYALGQEVIFPNFSFGVGKVVGERPGNNPEHGTFKVIEVEFEGGKRKEFASALETPHSLNFEGDGLETFLSKLRVDPGEIFEQYGDGIIEEIEARLVDEEDAICIGGKWFLRSLLADVGDGPLFLTEAVLDVAGTVPLTTAEILKEIGFAEKLPQSIREFSMNYALSQDARFDNVGSVGHVRWYLRRMEPPEIHRIPPRLEVDHERYDLNALSDEMRAVEAELLDEYSPLELPEKVPTEANALMIYPHRRQGSLGLNAALSKMLPISEESPRVLITMIDGQTNTPFPVWIIRESKYLFGLGEFYRRHKLPIGAFVTIKKTSDPLTFIINFKAHRPRTEYIRLVIPRDGRLRFENFKRSISAEYDDLLVLGAEEIDGVDEVWSQTRARRRKLADTLIDLIPELARLNPQNYVHLKTLYSAVNVIKRCPPGPIFATLATHSAFQHVSGAYWRLSEQG